MGAGDIGDTLYFNTVTLGREDGIASSLTYTAASNRPWAPDQFRGVKDSVSGDWTFTWARRSRVAGDFMPGDPPLGESAENYELRIYAVDGFTFIRTITATSETATYDNADQVTDFGGSVEDIDVEVAQIGDLVDGYPTRSTFQVDSSGFDPDFSSTILLLSFDGTAGSTTFTDESFALHGTATVDDDAQVDTATARVRFGSGSLRCDGTSDKLRFGDDADWTFGAAEFTIEGWFYFDSAKIEDDQALVSHYNFTGNQRAWIFEYRGGSATNNLAFIASSDGVSNTTVVSFNWTPTVDTWYHLAVDRDSADDFRLYINGAMVAKANNAITIFNGTSSLAIGATVSSGLDFHGNIDELRMSSIARYASDGGFVPPALPYPRQ